MADSSLTKRALAAAMKQLMAIKPFSKISVSDICDRCSMNRKSFYYHFKDKYELVNWIYDSEFVPVVSDATPAASWDFLLSLCRYMHENRAFYRKALEISGQNSFADHFREMLRPVIRQYLQSLFADQNVTDFYVNFFADGVVSTIERWIQEPEAIAAEAFVEQVKACIYTTADRVYHQMESGD